MIGLVGVIVSSTSIFQILHGYHVSAKNYQEIQEIYKAQDERLVGSKMITMKDLNDEYVGWISIHDTKIDYPVVKAKDNEFYLTRNFYKEKDKAGSIFMDFRNSTDQLDKNTIIYGHNMKDQSMFGSLQDYKTTSFLEEHSVISLDFVDEHYEWEVFSVYSVTDTEWMETSFTSDQEFEIFLQSIRRKSIIDLQTDVTVNDQILTLSTCTNVEEDERMIVHAKLISKGEGIES